MYAAGVAVEAAVVTPGHDETVVSEAGDRGFVLRACRRGVDRDLATDLGAVRVEALGDHVVAIAAVVVVGVPSRDEATTGQGSDVHLSLFAEGLRVGLELATDRRAVGVKTLPKDSVSRSVLAAR